MQINKRLISFILAFSILTTIGTFAFAPRKVYANPLLPALVLEGGGGLGVGGLLASSGPAILGVGSALALYYGFENRDYLLYKAQQVWGVLDAGTRAMIQEAINTKDSTVTFTKSILEAIDNAYQGLVKDTTTETVQITNWNGMQLLSFPRNSGNGYDTYFKEYNVGRAFTLNNLTKFSLGEVEDGTLALFRDGVQVKTDYDTNTFILDGTAFNIYFASGWDTASLSTAKDYFFIPTISATTGRPGLTALYEDAWTFGLYRELCTVYPRDVYADGRTYTPPKEKTKDVAVSANGSVAISKEDIAINTLNPSVSKTETETGTETGTGTGTETGVISNVLNGLYDIIVSAFKYLFVPPQDLVSNEFSSVKEGLMDKYSNDLGVIKALSVTPDSFGDICINTGSLNLWKGINGGNTEVTIISAKSVNDHIGFIRIVTSMFWMFLLVVYVYNQIYFLIRGTYPIKGGDYRTANTGENFSFSDDSYNSMWD